MSNARKLMMAAAGNGGGAYSMFTWGTSSEGILGDSVGSRNSPVLVGASNDFYWLADNDGNKLIMNRQGGTNVKSDGTLWVWGQGASGGLGDGTTVNKSSPVQIGALTDWYGVGYGCYDQNRRFFLKTNGTLWATGDNGSSGCLGNNSLADVSSPIQIGALTNWTVNIASGQSHTNAIKTDGTLWGWGSGDGGRRGATGAVSSPVQIGALTNWSTVACGSDHTISVKTDGTLWGWGYNYFGALGDGTTTTRNSPVQIGALTNWGQIDAGRRLSASVKTDGTLWMWGYNNAGQLGQGNTTAQSSPVQVGAGTDWLRISLGNRFALATKTNGTLWAWGDGGSTGFLGLGNNTDYSSPVQVGSEADWKFVSAGGINSLGLREI